MKLGGQWMAGALVVAFSVLVFRLFQLQIYQGDQYKQRAEHNHIRQIAIIPPRGVIYDRNKTVLAENRPRYSFFLVPFEYNNHPEDAGKIESLLAISNTEIKNRISERSLNPFRPFRLISDVDFSMIAEYEESRNDYPGLFYQIEPVRSYPSEANMSHVLGYLGEISSSEAKQKPFSRFEWGDIIGKSGIEKEYNRQLWGKRGYRYVEVDVRGHEVGNFSGLRDVDPIPGQNLMLTLDAQLQLLAESLFQGRRGALVVMDPAQGDILAYVSSPDFSLDALVNPSTNMWAQLLSNSSLPLLNRGIQAQLPPGSTFKLVTAMAGLKQGVNWQDEVNCPGYYRIGRRLFHCWDHEGHGDVNMKQAIARSCNVYFYQMGMSLGIDRWSDEAKQWQFGEKTNIDLPDEKSGLLPSRKYMDDKFGSGKWSPAIQANIAVGQGDLLVTPVQMLRMVSAIAMRGTAVVPHVIRGFENRERSIWERISPQFQLIGDLPKEKLEVIIDGMYAAVNQAGGTATASGLPNVAVCGKTGTAQNPNGDPHAWYVGFAPKEEPRLSIVVLVENGGSGGAVAAPLAGQVFRFAYSHGMFSK